MLIRDVAAGYVKEGKVDKRQKTFGGKTWYTTGDRGVKDVDGYYWFVGRDDDVSSPRCLCSCFLADL